MRFFGERGASAPLGAAALLAVFASATLTVDAGNAWQNRRNMVLATDAGALAEAERLALSPAASCTGDWQTLLTRNAGDDWYAESGEGCIVHEYGDTGYLTVDAHQPSSSFFSGIVGIGDGAVYSLSGAMWGYVSGLLGLRPMGVCVYNHHVQEWLAYQNGSLSTEDYQALRGSDPEHPMPVGSTGVVHRVGFTKDSPDHCGTDAPGNWGWMDFNGGNNATSEQRKWVHDGYEGTVTVGDCYSNGTNQRCPGDSGSSGWSPSDDLNYLIDNEITFHIPVYDNVSGTGSGALFQMVGFLGVRLWDYQINGAEKFRHFTYEFLELIGSGPCCHPAPPGPDTGVRGVRLCAVDHDPLTVQARCDVSP